MANDRRIKTPAFERGAPALKADAMSVPEHALDQELDGEIVLLDLKSGVYFGLNEVGSRMWTHLSLVGDLDEIMGLLLDEFDVDKDTLLKDLHELCHRLKSLELITLEDGFHAQIIEAVSS